MSTLDYYNENAINYYNKTIDADMSIQYELFKKYLKPNSKILDFGCGSGRDIKYFLNEGYDVTGLDGSSELCALAHKLTNTKIINMNFLDFKEKNKYDGIWACSSLLHLNNIDLEKVLIKLKESIKKDGIIYISLKDGIGEEIDNNGRYYNYMTKKDIELLSNKIGLEIIDYLYTSSVINNKDNWNNFILRRKHGTI